jgi:hypothetical protein
MEQRTDHSKGAKVDDAVLARVRQGMNGLRVPDMGTPVLKDEWYVHPPRLFRPSVSNDHPHLACTASTPRLRTVEFSSTW